MISIVDPQELQHVLRPTVYAAAIGLETRASSRGLPAESVRSPTRLDSSLQDESVSSSRHD
jgi:hypothetical protein